MTGRLVLNRSRAKVMGVAAGLSDWTGPAAVLLYFLTGWLATDDR